MHELGRILPQPCIHPVYECKLCNVSVEVNNFQASVKREKNMHENPHLKCTPKEWKKFVQDMNTKNGVMKFYNEKTWALPRIFIPSSMHDFSIIQIFSFQSGLYLDHLPY